MGTKTVKVTVLRKGVRLWSQQWLDMPVASPKWPLPKRRGRGEKLEWREPAKTGKMTGELRFWCQIFAFCAACL